MKILLIAMLVLSLFVGIPINGQWTTLYGSEFISIPGLIKHGLLSYLKIFIWIVLLSSHFGLIVLIFIVRKNYFKKVLIYAPMIFIISFTMFDPIHLLFLIPFIIIWVICLLKARRYKYAIKS